MEEEYFGKEVKKLGFGLMRLPRKGPSIDVKETSKMVDVFMENGFTYFDTAFIYIGSEAAAKKALVDRYPRESYTLASKLFEIRNKQIFSGKLDEAKAEYASLGLEASGCIGCGQCERVCPQKIDIVNQLKICAGIFE